MYIPADANKTIMILKNILLSRWVRLMRKSGWAELALPRYAEMDVANVVADNKSPPLPMFVVLQLLCYTWSIYTGQYRHSHPHIK